MTTDRRSLRQFVHDELPLVDAEFSRMGSMDSVRVVLNAATGERFCGSDSIGATCGVYLTALQDAKQKGLLTLVVLPKAIKAIAALREAE